jgi:hypothetical protein
MYCICSERICLDRNYNSGLFDHYVKAMMETQITQFFSNQNLETLTKRNFVLK